MARKKPASKVKSPAKETSEAVEDKIDAVIADDAEPDTTAQADAKSDDEAPDEAVETEEPSKDEPEATDDEMPEPEADNTESTDETPSLPDPTPMPGPTEQVVIRKGGFVPVVLGGLIAAAIGFGVARYVLPDGGMTAADFRATTTKALDTQTADLASLSNRIAALSDGPDLSGIETTQADLDAAVSSLTDRISALESQLGDFDTRLMDMAARPLTEGASEAAVAAYEQELKKLQDAMATQRAEIEAMATGARAMEENAQVTAEATMRRAAITRIQTALENGTGFADALADLDAAGATAPEALTRVAQNGVASLATLQDSFPDVARNALAASRNVAIEGGEQSGFSAFLRNQLGARSLEPREGSDPDAVLSRAEAAVREGRLMDALAEIEALPEVGRAELSDWAGRVAQRANAIDAAQALSENLN